MDKDYELKYHKLEKDYWWFRARRQMILNLAKDLDRGKKILEIGCSGGILIESLKKMGFKSVYGIDVSKNAVELCKRKGIKNVEVMDGAKTRFKDGSFDLVIASDVLEHIKDDSRALSDWHRILKNDGKLILFVPAFSSLWSRHDEANNHFRRYTRPLLVEQLKRAHFKLQKASYWNFMLFFPSYVLKKRGNKDHLDEIGSFMNSMLAGLMGIENSLARHLDFPFGVSVFAVCRKQR